MHIWELHAAGVHFPIAFLLGAVALDLFGVVRKSEPIVRAASWMLIVGVVLAALAAASGLVAFYTVPKDHTQEAHDRVIYHLWVNVAAIVLFGVAAFARWRRPAGVTPAIRGLGLVAAGVLTVGAYLGGYIVYQGGMGIDPAILRPNLRPGIEGK